MSVQLSHRGFEDSSDHGFKSNAKLRSRRVQRLDTSPPKTLHESSDSANFAS